MYSLNRLAKSGLPKDVQGSISTVILAYAISMWSDSATCPDKGSRIATEERGCQRAMATSVERVFSAVRSKKANC